MFGRTIRFPKRLPLFSAVQYLISGKLCAINICGPFLRNDAKCAGTSEDHDIQSEFPSRRTASSATPIGVSGHRFSLQNKCELGDSLSVTSFAHLGGKWAGVHNESFSIRKQRAFSQVRRCPSSALYSSAIRSSSRSLKLLKLSGDFKVYESNSPFRSFQPSPPISTI